MRRKSPFASALPISLVFLFQNSSHISCFGASDYNDQNVLRNCNSNPRNGDFL